MARTGYIPRDRDGNPIGDPIPYTPIMVTAGTTTYRLALYRDKPLMPRDLQPWVVADPISGGVVCRVQGWHKGVPCSSAGCTAPHAARLAQEQLLALLERIGAERFCATIDAARDRVVATTA